MSGCVANFEGRVGGGRDAKRTFLWSQLIGVSLIRLSKQNHTLTHIKTVTCREDLCAVACPVLKDWKELSKASCEVCELFARGGWDTFFIGPIATLPSYSSNSKCNLTKMCWRLEPGGQLKIHI